MVGRDGLDGHRAMKSVPVDVSASAIIQEIYSHAVEMWMCMELSIMMKNARVLFAQVNCFVFRPHISLSTTRS